MAQHDFELHRLLLQYWGYQFFRPLQKQIIDHALTGDDVLALLPTGGGKSLCYQLPALLLDGCVLVISPLIALMKDQVAQLRTRSIPADMLSSGMSEQAMLTVMQQAADKELKLLYVSPERLQSDLFRNSLHALNIRMIAVDEAHCISQWGHDFRPEYRKIKTIREALPHVPVMALTASATPAVAQDIRSQLYLKGGYGFRESFRRPNILYSIIKAESKENSVLEAVKKITDGSAIVYCRSRRQTESLARFLTAGSVPAIAYHAGLDQEKRTEHQELWMSGLVKVVVATTAFGMGIDKPDVRLVMHCEPPDNLESYYQESGRAGRDGQPASAVMLYRDREIRQLRDSTDLQFPGVPYLRQVYQSVCDYLQIPISAEPQDPMNFDTADFCKKFELREQEAKPALRQLAKEGLWLLQHSDHSKPTVVFTVHREVLDGLSHTHPSCSLLCLWLLRLYEDILYYPVAIDPGILAKKLKLSLSHLWNQLEALQQLGILRAQLPLKGETLWFTHRRVDSRYLLVDTAAIDQRREAHRAQATAMIGFVTGSVGCRTALMLLYFGESLSGNCGQCDCCLDKSAVPSAFSSNPEAEIRKQLLDAGKPVRLSVLLSRFPERSHQALLTWIKEAVDRGVLMLPTPTTVSLRHKSTR